MVHQVYINKGQSGGKLACQAIIRVARRTAVAGVIVGDHEARCIGLYGEFKHFTRKNSCFVDSTTRQYFVVKHFELAVQGNDQKVFNVA